MDYALVAVFLLAVGALPVMLWRMYRQAEALGAASAPLTAEDRLRVSLTRRMLEDARRELAKAQHLHHPEVSALAQQMGRAEDLCESLLRRS